MIGTRSSKGRLHEQAARLLVERRRAQKLVLIELSAQTGIPVSKLTALEAGDFSVFAAEVYGRGAYLKYARALGIDEKVAERMVAQALRATREHVPLRVYVPFPWLTRFLTPRTVLLAGVAGIGVLVSGYITWQVQSFLRLPQLKLLEPAAAAVDTGIVVVRGRAETSARVAVNGEAVLLNEDGNFEITLVLHPGINVLRLEAENAAGRVRVVEKHLLWSRTKG
jgi:hypothetical protein